MLWASWKPGLGVLENSYPTNLHNQPQILPKSIQKRSQIHPKSVQNPPLNAPKSRSGRDSASDRFRNPFFLRLGGVLGRFARLLGPSWVVLGVLGRLGGILGASWGVLEASWACPGASWERPGASWWLLGAFLDRKKKKQPVLDPILGSIFARFSSQLGLPKT